MAQGRSRETTRDAASATSDETNAPAAKAGEHRDPAAGLKVVDLESPSEAAPAFPRPEGSGMPQPSGVSSSGAAGDGGSTRGLTAREEKQLEDIRYEYNEQIKNFNRILSTTSGQVRDDRKFGWIRGLAIVVLAALMIGATVAVLITSQHAGTDPVPVVATSAVLVVALLFAGWVNPLQTIERDMVFRRWSDTIVATWVLEAGHIEAGPEQVEQAGRRATLRFAQLATSYAATAAKATDALVSMAGIASAASADSGAPAKTISVTNPGDQSATEGTKLKPTLMIVASGPGTLAYSAATDHPLPGGLTISERTGEISGTPSTAGKFPVVVNVATDKDSVGTVSCAFDYVVAAAKADANSTASGPPATPASYTSTGQ